MGNSDPALDVALLREVESRRFAAGWFWRRWLKPGEFQKWEEHREALEALSTQKLIDHLGQSSHPDPQEVVEQLRRYKRGSEGHN